MPTLTTVSILGDIVKCIEDIHDAVSELSKKAHFKQLLHDGIVSPIDDHDEDCIAISIHEISSEFPKKEGTLPLQDGLRCLICRNGLVYFFRM